MVAGRIAAATAWPSAPPAFTSNQLTVALTSFHFPHPQVGQTTLYIPVGLQAVYGDAKNWAFQGGFVG